MERWASAILPLAFIMCCTQCEKLLSPKLVKAVFRLTEENENGEPTQMLTDISINPCDEKEIFGEINIRCPKTCEFRNRSCLSQELIEGCICAEGYIRRSLEDPTCIPVEECEATCSRPHFKWSDCYPLCELSCLHRNQEYHCKRGCGIGCLCEKGFVLDERKQRCVKKWDGCPEEEEDSSPF